MKTEAAAPERGKRACNCKQCCCAHGRTSDLDSGNRTEQQGENEMRCIEGPAATPARLSRRSGAHHPATYPPGRSAATRATTASPAAAPPMAVMRLVLLACAAQSAAASRLQRPVAEVTGGAVKSPPQGCDIDALNLDLLKVWNTVSTEGKKVLALSPWARASTGTTYRNDPPTDRPRNEPGMTRNRPRLDPKSTLSRPRIHPNSAPLPWFWWVGLAADREAWREMEVAILWRRPSRGNSRPGTGCDTGSSNIGSRLMCDVCALVFPTFDLGTSLSGHGTELGVLTSIRSQADNESIPKRHRIHPRWTPTPDRHAPTEEVGPYDNTLGRGDVLEVMCAQQALLERRFARLLTRAPSGVRASQTAHDRLMQPMRSVGAAMPRTHAQT